MSKQLLFCLHVFVMIAILSCGQSEKNAVPISVSFKWNPPCTSLNKSPEIKLGDMPDRTVRLYIGMTDLDMPSYNHGGGYVAYENQTTIPAGFLKGSYTGPSPPSGVTHRYEIKVKAFDEKKKVIGVGKISLIYPPEGEEEIRWSNCD